MSIDYISLPIREFCRVTGMGETLARQMIADGRLRAVRVGRKKLLVDVESWREYMRKQAADGTPEYRGTGPAIAARQAKREDAAVDLESIGLL